MKKRITLQFDLGSKLLLLFLGVGLWIIALKPITDAPQAGAETYEEVKMRDRINTDIFNTAASTRTSEDYNRPTQSSSQSYNEGGNRSLNLERIAPPPWNTLGANQMLIDSELPHLMRDYGYTRMEAYCHFILWELTALERRMRE